jgi:2',3'-cyclic-nucleotide 2'-phosphodiesterase (5'-nucleotidase family)
LLQNQLKYHFMRVKHFLFSLCLSLLALACSTTQKGDKTNPTSNNFTEAIFLQINDVYEIGALDNGKVGGLPRVATILEKLRAENPNTYFVLAGDFFSPSVIGTLKYEGKGIKGRQMVDVLNNMGLNYAILGNHEFDLDEPDFQERVNESKFKWISTDVNTTNNQPFTKKNPDGTISPFLTSDIVRVKGNDGNSFKIGLFSATIPIVNKPWISYNNYKTTAQNKVEQLSKSCDVVLGITHLAIVQDRELATLVPTVPLFMGGHDHDNMLVQEGNTFIAKADANAKTIYIHRVRMDNKTRKVTVSSELVAMDEKVVENAATAEVVKKWKDIAMKSMESQGFSPNALIKKLTSPLDGRESTIRNKQCELGNLIATAMQKSSKDAKAIAFFNSGSVRVDDQLTGNLTEYDAIRIMPYGGSVVELLMTGELVKRILDAGENNKGRGGYLQRSANIVRMGENWAINGVFIDDKKQYTVVTGAYLYSGKEQGIEFFHDRNPGVIKADIPKAEHKNDLRNDIRKLFIDYIKKN